MWPLSWPIKVSQIPKSCEKLWDFIQKYFHLNSLAVYNSSAKKGNLSSHQSRLELRQYSRLLLPLVQKNAKASVEWWIIWVCFAQTYKSCLHQSMIWLEKGNLFFGQKITNKLLIKSRICWPNLQCWIYQMVQVDTLYTQIPLKHMLAVHYGKCNKAKTNW